jgi:hypothetical protein
MTLQPLHPLADLDGSFATRADERRKQGVGRRLLAVVLDGRVEMLELVIAELGQDLLQQRDGRVRAIEVLLEQNQLAVVEN